MIEKYTHCTNACIFYSLYNSVGVENRNGSYPVFAVGFTFHSLCSVYIISHPLPAFSMLRISLKQISKKYLINYTIKILQFMSRHFFASTYSTWLCFISKAVFTIFL